MRSHEQYMHSNGEHPRSRGEDLAFWSIARRSMQASGL